MLAEGSAEGRDEALRRVAEAKCAGAGGAAEPLVYEVVRKD